MSVSALSLLLVLCATAAADAQERAEPQTRAEALRREREEKQKTVEPYKPTPLERAMDIAENRVFPLLPRDGLYARFGSLATGSGFAYGAGYRDRSLVQGRGSIDLWAAGSLKRYWALEARAAFPLTEDGRLSLGGYVRQHSYPQEEFFGSGPDSRRSDRSMYRLKGPSTGGSITWRPVDRVRASGALDYLAPTVSAATNDDVPSVERRFFLGDLPGFDESHRFVRSTARLEYDYRQPLNARKGGWYQVALARYADRRSGAFTFTRTDIDLRQYVSILAERRVFAFRAHMASTSTDDGRVVPFFLQPSLGGNDTLRGFRAHRFRGAHALLLQGEYRWEIWSGLEAALFYDTGKVASRRVDLTRGTFERDYGFGFRFNTDNGVVMRVDAAFGSRDGRHLHIVFGGIF